ncbi:MAG: IS6 family transposase [Nitrososphaerota archaeon]|nr:IS6 family transposase [Nitrososphaerota archaeon]
MRLEVAKGQQMFRIAPISKIVCPQCNSDIIVKHGLLHNKYGDLQRYTCKRCNKRFVQNLGFEKLHASPQAVTSAMQLYFTGESLRNVEKFLRLQGVNVDHVTIYRWIQKYVSLMQDYVERLHINSSNTWRTDELYVKVKGDMKYLFAVMDDETRFWISQQIAYHKGTSNIRRLFAEAKERTGKEPAKVISDGAPNYKFAIQREYSKQTKHIAEITLDGERHNNKMERMNGEFRDREKVMRGLKSVKSPAFRGYQIFHNFIREHEGLNGKTPAEASGIKIEGENKWKTLIENASMSRTETARIFGLVSK